MLAEHLAEQVIAPDQPAQKLPVRRRRGDHAAGRFRCQVLDAERLVGIPHAGRVTKFAIQLVTERGGICAAQTEVHQQLLVMATVVAEPANVARRKRVVAPAAEAALHRVVAIAEQRRELAARALNHVGAKHPFGGGGEPHRLVGANALALLAVHEHAAGIADFPVVVAQALAITSVRQCRFNGGTAHCETRLPCMYHPDHSTAPDRPHGCQHGGPTAAKPCQRPRLPGAFCFRHVWFPAFYGVL